MGVLYLVEEDLVSSVILNEVNLFGSVRTLAKGSLWFRLSEVFHLLFLFYLSLFNANKINFEPKRGVCLKLL